MNEQERPADGAPGDPDAPAGVEEAGGWIGAKLDEMGGGAVGRIAGLLVDSVDGTPTWLIVRLGRFGRHAAVPLEFAAGGAGRVWVPIPRETIRAASAIDPLSGLSSGEERALAATYATAERSPRLRLIAGRDDDEPGSIPAG